MKAKEFIPASKPRNFVAKNQKTGGAGAHRDKKKEQKQGYEKHKNKDVSEGINPDELIGYVYDSKNRYLGQWDGQRLVIDPNVWKKWKDENGQDWASGMVGMAKDRIARGVWKVHQEKQGVAEYGDTARGQKMLTKVQKRAVDRVVSKRADTDPAYAKKNKATADRAWDRMSDKDESIEMERVRDPEDWDEGNTEPPNNFAIYINGKKWKVFQGRGRYADDEREMKQFYDLKAWCQRKSDATGKKWEVSRTGEPATA